MSYPRERKRLIDKLLSTSIDMIAIAEGPLQLVPIPGVQQVAKVLSEILKMVRRTRSNTEEALRLAGRLKALVDLLVSTLDAIQKQAENALGSNSEIAATGLRRSQDLSDRVNRLLKGVESILDEEETLTKGNFFTRFFRSGEDESTLQSLKEQVQETQLQFQLEGTLKIESGVSELIQIAQISEWERELNSISTVDAGYRAPVNSRKSHWLEGTRTGLLSEIEEWSRGEGLDATRANARIFVLAGGAGTGKSTIAVQVAKFLDEAGALGGSYFFERGVEELSTTRFVFPTLAVQLARSHHNLAPFIVEGIKKHRPKGNTQQLLYTLDELVIEPLRAVHKDLWPSRPIVFVIDALDECSEQEQVPHMLYLLLKRIRSLAFPLRLFLTTRPEYHLQDAFTSDEWKSEPEPFLLTSIPVNVVRDDIKRFIDVRLMDIGIAQKLKAIQDDAVEKLTDAADGLFIYASTAMEFLARYQRDLGKTLALVLNHPLNVDSLDALYDVVLCNAFSGNDFRHPDLGPAIPVVLGVLAVIQDQLAPSHLSSLLQLDLTTLDEVLYRLQSVLTFSKYNPIRLLHASFPQYLANPARCRLPELSNNPSFHGHDYLGKQCLNTLLDGNNLKMNICDLEDPLIFLNEIGDLNDLLTRSIPPHVQYSCLHWTFHLCNSTPSLESISLLGDFAEMKMLSWMEALGMLGQIDTAVPVFTQILHWYKVNDRTRTLLNDGYRFVMTFMDAIKACPFQVYATGLPFSPTQSLLRTVYAHQVDDLRIVNVLTGLDEGWGPCLRMMEGHKGGVRSVVFSHDGEWIASAGDDHLVKIWDSAVGVLRRTFSGHTAAVETTVFSSDDRILFSGSSDGTIRMWNTTSEAPLKVINLGAPVDCIALSPNTSDIQRIFAICKVFDGSKDMGFQYRIMFRILDTSGRALQVLNNDLRVDPGHHTHWSILDRKYFAVTARNRIVLYDSDQLSVWDAKEFVDPQGDVGDVNVFPQSDILLSGTRDGAVRVWQIEMQTCIHVIKVHTGLVWSIAVNPLKGLIASASNDSSICLWSLQEKTCVSMHPLPNCVSTLSFSPNGETLVSGDSESMLQLWDVQGRPETTPLEVAHRETPSSWVISPDGRFIAGLVPNNVTEIWSTRDDRLVASIAPYKTGISLDSLVSSKDGIWVALLMDGRSLYLINIVTQEISYLTLGLEPEGPSLKHSSPMDTTEGPQSSQEGLPNPSNGRLIYLRFSEFQEDEVEVGRWYLLNWHLREIAVVDEKDVPQEYLNPPQQRYTQQEGWLVDRQQNKHLCWLPPSFRGDHGDESCFLLEDALGSRYFSISGSHRITVVDLSKPGEEEESDGWRTVYNCIRRVLERFQW